MNNQKLLESCNQHSTTSSWPSVTDNRQPTTIYAHHRGTLQRQTIKNSRRDQGASDLGPAARDALQHPHAANRRGSVYRCLRRIGGGGNRSAFTRRGACHVRRDLAQSLECDYGKSSPLQNRGEFQID